jgi:hypothetical protein
MNSAVGFASAAIGHDKDNVMPSAFSAISQTSFVCLALLGALLLQPGTASAASLSAKDVQIVAKAMGFLDPPPAGGAIAVIYSGADAASKADADAIVALFGDGVSMKGGSIKANAIEAAALGDAGGYVGIIVAAGVVGDSAINGAKTRHIPCVTGNLAIVEAGRCLMAVQSEPKVNITVNRDAAKAAGVAFAPAFSMLIHEI